MRDPTRGGIAQTLNEIVKDKSFGIEIWERHLPISQEVESVCEILGFDPLNLANEGKVLVIASKKDAEMVLETMKRNPLGKMAKKIGRITRQNKGMVVLKTTALSERIVVPPSGELIPRIC
jgi:hydrogenase expression/formation protein HypE